MAEHIHTVRDGRGRRRVFVNGNEVTHALHANTLTGVVEYAPQPLRIHKTKRDQIYTRRLRGRVEVRPWQTE